METITGIAALRGRIAATRRQGFTVGCVPTMGALHRGHGALIDKARQEAEFVVVTIFVNPTQFERIEDFERYGRDLFTDLAFCKARSVDVVFTPTLNDVYPEPAKTFVDVPEIASHLCGALRTGHFRAVATVVAKLFNVVQPDVACFGEKDAQQLAVIQQMVRDLNFPVRIVAVPTVREADGLALSSRNVRLTGVERALAPILFRALSEAQMMVAGGERSASKIKSLALCLLASSAGVRVEYFEIVDARNMQPVESIAGDVRLAAAVWLGSTRLIDNVLCRS